MDERAGVEVHDQLALGRSGQAGGRVVVPARFDSRGRHPAQPGQHAPDALWQGDLAALGDVLAELPVALLGPGGEERRPVRDGAGRGGGVERELHHGPERRAVDRDERVREVEREGEEGRRAT